MSQQLKFFAYISRAKVQQLHEQLTEMAVTQRTVRRSRENKADAEVGSTFWGMVKAAAKVDVGRSYAVEESGNQTVIQQLAAVMDHIETNERVLDLEELCTKRAGVALDAFAYSYGGRFFSLATFGRDHHRGIQISTRSLENASDDIIISKSLLLEPGRAENALPETGPNQGKLVSDMCIITTRIGDFDLNLACSFKYFTDMGGSWGEQEKEWTVAPHSGNYHFFRGDTSMWFDTLIFITGLRGTTIMGTPLFLIQRSDKGLTI